MTQPQQDDLPLNRTPEEISGRDPEFELLQETPKSEEPPIEIFSDINAYQQRIENEWEKARSNYQSKINQILDEFISQNLHEPKNAPPSRPTRPVDSSPSMGMKKPFKMDREISAAEERLEHLLQRVEKAVRLADQKSFERKNPLDSQLSWDGWERRQTFRAARKWMALGLGVALLVFGGIWTFVRFYGASSSIALPYSHATGLILKNDKFIVVDWFRKALYLHARQSKAPILSVENIPNQFVTGLASSETKLWSLDGLSYEFIEHATTPDHHVIKKWPSPGKKPAGLFFDGLSLWSADNETGKLYRYQGTDLEEIRDEYAIPSMDVTSFSIIKNRVWILSEKSRVIRVFRLEDPLKEFFSYDLDGILDGASPTGMAVTEKEIWLTTDNPSRLLRLSRRKLDSAKIGLNS